MSIELILLTSVLIRPGADSVRTQATMEWLYQPIQEIELREVEVRGYSPLFTYTFDRNTETWSARPNQNVWQPSRGDLDGSHYRDRGREAQYHLLVRTDSLESAVSIRRFQENEIEALGRVELYDREMVADAWYDRWHYPKETPARFEKRLLLAQPRLAGVADDGRSLWFSFAYDAHDTTAGVGSVLRLDTVTDDLEVFRPETLRNSSLSNATTSLTYLWLATERVGPDGPEPDLGLVRFEPGSRTTKSHLPHNSPIVGRLVTALESESDSIWVATDEGICLHSALPELWRVWRFHSEIHVRWPTPLSDSPGLEPRITLRQGKYEVRWVTADSLQIETRDAVRGWIHKDVLKELEAAEEEQALYRALRPDAEFPPLVLFSEPDSTSTTPLYFYRTSFRKLPMQTAEGWRQVEIHAGWIPRGNLAIRPVVTEIEIPLPEDAQTPLLAK